MRSLTVKGEKATEPHDTASNYLLEFVSWNNKAKSQIDKYLFSIFQKYVLNFFGHVGTQGQNPEFEKLQHKQFHYFCEYVAREIKEKWGWED